MILSIEANFFSFCLLPAYYEALSKILDYWISNKGQNKNK